MVRKPERKRPPRPLLGRYSQAGRAARADGRTNVLSLPTPYRWGLLSLDASLRELDELERIEWSFLKRSYPYVLDKLVLNFGSEGLCFTVASPHHWRVERVCQCGGMLRAKDAQQITCEACSRVFGAWRGELLSAFLEGRDYSSLNERELPLVLRVMEASLTSALNPLRTALVLTELEPWLHRFHQECAPLR